MMRPNIRLSARLLVLVIIMMYADVIIDISHEKLDKTFLYRVPETMERDICEGMVVQVPFGKSNRLRTGYVIGLSDTAEFQNDKIKDLAGLVSGEETTETQLIRLAAWMRRRYGSTMIQALRTVIPIHNKIQAKEQKYLELAIPKEQGEKILESLRGSRFKARERLLGALLARDILPAAEASRELGASASVIRYFVEHGWVRIRQEEVYRSPLKSIDVSGREQEHPSAEQREAAAQILEEWSAPSPRPVLLHGVTGSGKTLVYIELIRQVLAKGGQAIVLIPEIALTYQTVQRFYAQFGEKVSVLNSKLSQGERYDQFRRAKKGEIQVMIGPRSALFTPFSNLALIIVDEEHEPTYKSEHSPRYHAVEVAKKRGELEGAKLLLGSATPSLEAYSRAEAGEYKLVTLGARYEDRPLPTVEVVDMREEIKAGNRSVLGRSLQRDLTATLAAGQQAILFLNRRGYAGFVSCRSCGTVMKCPHCDVSLTEHRGGKLICHYCGYERARPETCPVCGSPYVGGFKAGTQQIEQVLAKSFPSARVLRMDYDTTRQKGSYERILASFASHEADILVGTQMVVKGHDFPGVTLVGVIAADLSLNSADYRCGERTFQLLTQVVGRAGRGILPGKAVIQTYHPEHYSILAAAEQDYQAFYQEEMSYRLLLGYPPAAHMLAILGSCEQEEKLEMAMEYLGRFVRRVYPGEELHIIGPAPDSVGKIRDSYKMSMYLKHADERILTGIRKKLEKYIEVNTGFQGIYIQYDLQ